MSKPKIIQSKKLDRVHFSPQNLKSEWIKKFLFFKSKLYHYKIVENFDVIDPALCDEKILLLAHAPEYVEFIKEKSNSDEMVPISLADTWTYPGVFEDALLGVCATLDGAKKMSENNFVFNPYGGFHHAKRNLAGGFCIFNDIAVAALYLKKYFNRIAIVDIDLHHGDGTQKILYKEPILKISMHGFGIFPHSGKPDEIGDDKGKGYNINIPLELGSCDDVGIYVLDKIIFPALEKYKPEVVIAQMGTDAHKDDWMRALSFTYEFYKHFAIKMKDLLDGFLEHRLLGLGGGGYTPQVTSDAWMVMLSALVGFEYDKVKPQPKTTSQKEHINFIKEVHDKLKDMIDYVD